MDVVNLVELRWPDGPFCPFCGAWPPLERRVAGTRANHGDKRAYSWEGWRCVDCRKDFTVTTGTWLHGTRVPLETWVRFAERVGAGPVGWQELVRELDVDKGTVRRMLQVLEEAAGVEGRGLVSPQVGDARVVLSLLLGG